MLEVLLAIAVIGVLAYLFWKYLYVPKEIKRIYHDLDSLGIPREYCGGFNKVKQVTPKGARVMSQVRLPDSFLAAIDEGIESQITRHNAKYPFWANYKSVSDYDVICIKPMTHNVETEPGSPALLVSNGTQQVQTAGTCIGAWPMAACKKPYIVLPHQLDEGWKYLNYFMLSAWFESEHVREWRNDYATWEMYIGAGDHHPHVS